MGSFASSIMKNIFVLAFKISPAAFCPLSRFPVKLICCIALDQRQVFVGCLNLLSFYSTYWNNYNQIDYQ